MCPPVLYYPANTLCVMRCTDSLRLSWHQSGVLLHRPCKGLTRDTHTMASVLKSISSAIITTFDTIGDVGSAVQKTVGMATNYIDRQATSADIVGIDSIKLTTAQELRVIQSELEADAKLKAIFDLLEDRFTK